MIGEGLLIRADEEMAYCLAFLKIVTLAIVRALVRRLNGGVSLVLELAAG
jgi:hypothetical protein